MTELPDVGIEELFAAEYGRLAGYLRNLVGDEALARDLAQEAFVRLFTRWVGVREPRPYLYLVGTNLARRHWRTRARDENLREALAAATPEPAGLDVVPVRDAVERLPERLRTVVLLHYFADLSVREVAALIGKPEGSVKQRLHEARRVLARRLGPAT